MTRIVAGIWGGRRLVTPAGAVTRPTAEKVRAALGSSLTAGGGLAGARVLDLFAGSGALGLELLSRGADTVDLVERDRAALVALRQNVQTLGADRATVIPGDVAGFVGGLGGPAGVPSGGPKRYDIVVADPPYDLTDAEISRVLGALAAAGALAGGADLIVERPVRAGELTWPDPLVAVRGRRYGDTLLCYGRAP